MESRGNVLMNLLTGQEQRCRHRGWPCGAQPQKWGEPVYLEEVLTEIALTLCETA